MYLKKLELVGFKSFYDKTVLSFEPGITAVVGPNGCGKSNIFDAIRWVLGEQSIKALRGSEMQDVIFNGTDSKSPLSMAEITLVFDNKGKYFVVDNDEVAITRRIFRSGESEYLLNKTLVRLKDILDLLMGTGIGAESYSLVQQGKIDLILSSKPEDRRLVFDEASGITKYKAQKKEALRRLEETEQNLLRINDIVNEVKRQIGSLERQANKARRYKETFNELKAIEINLSIIQKKEFITKKTGIIDELKSIESQESGFLTANREQETLVLTRQDELNNLEHNINQIKDQIAKTQNFLSSSYQQIAFNKERLAEAEKTRLYLQTQIEQTQSRILQDEDKLNKFREEAADISRTIEEKNLLLKDKENLLNNIIASIRISAENISMLKKDVLALAAKIANLKNTGSDLTSKQQVFLSRKKRLDIEKIKVSEEKSIIEANLNAVNQEIDSLEINFKDSNNKLSDIKNDIESDNLSIKTISSDIELMEREKLTLYSQKEFLGKLKVEYEGLGESINAVIYLDKLPEEKISGLVVKINNINGIADEIVEKSTGFKLYGEAKPVDFDIEKISKKIEELGLKIESLNVIKRIKESRIGELTKELSDLQNQIRDQEISLANKKAYAQTIEEQCNKIKTEEELIIIEISDIEKDLADAEEKIVFCYSELNTLDKIEKSNEELILNEQNNIALNNRLKEENLVIITQIKTEIEALNNRIFSGSSSLKMLEDTYSQDKENLLNLENQVNICLTKKQSLISENIELENKNIEISQSIENQKILLKKRENKYIEIADVIKNIGKKIELHRCQIDVLKNKIYELQMQIKDVDFNYLKVRERILQAYKQDIDSLEVSIDLLKQDCDEENSITSENIEKLKARLDSYGTVNLVAIEEHDELKLRYDFLIQQQNDLISAKDSLHQAILKINRTTKKMFIETFEKICIEFHNYFRLLFNGGDAQVFLSNENDPLESGIEIICRPPGKKLQNVLLLSGGEKSMSAIALIFAIFKVKPCPFCILDEIDAALDEANIGRFGQILHEFAQNSQFIVITHNKKTISNANVMYGITMEQSGVSKIVSVKFSENKSLENNERILAAASV